MPPSTTFPVVSTLFVVAAVTYTFWTAKSVQTNAQCLSKSLPFTLSTWRNPGTGKEAQEKIWNLLEQHFQARGFTLWPYVFCYTFKAPRNSCPSASEFQYVIPARMCDENRIDTMKDILEFDVSNALSRVARTSEGHDVIIRVIVIRNEGYDHLKILRRFATGEKSLFNTNHILPMFQEVEFDGIIFGIFPKVGGNILNAYNSWTKNSVGDIIDMIMQSLEALAFIHEQRIAHRDAFHDNFLVEWHPESLLTNRISVSRPRVYLIDFEVAVEFPIELEEQDCASIGLPLGGSFDAAKYCRPHAPEFASGKAYNPFKLDVWQYGRGISNFKTTLPDIDKILAELIEPDPIQRPSSKEVLDKLAEAVYSLSPISLQIAPVTTDYNW